MSELKLSYSGYVCAPYLHNHESIELKDLWVKSKNVEKVYFATGTFSNESKPYFTESTNHYLVAKYKDSAEIIKNLEKFNQDKIAFMFDIREDLFERETDGKTNFISVYYLEYGDSEEDVKEVASLLVNREKIDSAGYGKMETYCTTPSKFTFPYAESILVIEVSSEKSHQSVKKYCDQTRRTVTRRGLTMSNMVSLSILETLK
ncbi:MAG: hypothetical protein GTN97_00410 [Nitrosopumilaceae archaeon]|nr:hypothetical protein [Nitrosopumilaceae archaeon]NIP10257.1 hypothetical protein [Nitrosopumilaceae archaeon]NIS94400.1 hypothetical protein [Nitrosopumilaceae archaeon]